MSITVSAARPSEAEDPQNAVVSWFKASLPRWVRYAYYLRFSILLWLFPIILRILNSPKLARSLMSGIITPVTVMQYVCVAFFLVAGGFVALVQARVVVINGNDRFGDKAPELLTWIFNNPRLEWEWLAPVLSQLSNFYLFFYFYSNGEVEKVKTTLILEGIAFGFGLALLFWYGLSAVYYILYVDVSGADCSKAKTLIFPRDIIPFISALERARSRFPIQWISRFFPKQGYRYLVDAKDKDGNPSIEAGPIYEGHFFSLVAAFGFYALYWVLWPLTAPLLASGAASKAITIYCLLALLVCGVVVSTTPRRGDKGKLLFWKVVLTIFILGFASSVPLIYYLSDPERFPVLASVLILVISVIWTFSGIAFFADRFRVPVLTAFVVAFVLPRMLPSPTNPITGAREEHYISYLAETVQTSVPDQAKAAGSNTLPTPGQILDQRLKLVYCGNKDCNKLPSGTKPTLIVVTSTGGGIHAAAWTTAVLGHLEQSFSNQFHQNVLLLSTVSGGSVGLYDYLREVEVATQNGAPNWDRMNSASSCSSLEAVGWGLIYYDLQKVAIPLIPYFFSPSPGKDDLLSESDPGASPLGKDRTWGLRQAMARNLDDEFCGYASAVNRPNSAIGPIFKRAAWIKGKQVEADQSAIATTNTSLTLAQLKAINGDKSIPAFTMNTTTVEGGNRFLLANYHIQRPTLPTQLTPMEVTSFLLAPQPANSFLYLYNSGNDSQFIDLPLATAAQMSATFPYVSSAATLKIASAAYGVHFVDGGYYDNDGTASAIEFLRHAVDESTILQNSGAQLRILLVEIRNSPDNSLLPVNGPGSAPSPALVAADAAPWNALDQVTAPLKGFWAAGHDSVTARNRNALGLLEGAYQAKLQIDHFVIDDQAANQAPLQCVPSGSKNPNDPLNWYLTPCQQQEVETSSANLANTTKYQSVKACFDDPGSSMCPPPDAEKREKNK
jgi:hypothetical protein